MSRARESRNNASASTTIVRLHTMACESRARVWTSETKREPLSDKVAKVIQTPAKTRNTVLTMVL